MSDGLYWYTLIGMVITGIMAGIAPEAFTNDPVEPIRSTLYRIIAVVLFWPIALFLIARNVLRRR